MSNRVSPPTEWLQPKAAAEYAGVSLRTVRTWYGGRGLPCAHVGGVILIARSDLDRFIRGFIEAEDRAAKIADEVIAEMLP